MAGSSYAILARVLLVLKLLIVPALVLTVTLAAAVGGFFAARALLPAARGPYLTAERSRWDLPLRTVTAAIAVFTLTELAKWIGPRLSGAFTAFPTALGILLVFTHAQQGPSSAIRFLHGFLPGMLAFALFVFVLAVAIVPLGTWVAFALAIVSLVPSQAIVLLWMNRRQVH
jgi:hypothetical protein